MSGFIEKQTEVEPLTSTMSGFIEKQTEVNHSLASSLVL